MATSMVATQRHASAEETLATLTSAVQELSLVRSLEDVQSIARTAARRLAQADGATFVLRDDDKCFYADEDAVSPLWKGQRFPLSACISGWAMLNRRPVAIEDIYVDERIPHEAYRPTFVKSLVMVPIRTMDPLGAIGVYWADRHRATEREIGAAQALADSTAVALEHVQMVERLERTVLLSQTDPLTGLPNRRAWDAALADLLAPPHVHPACVAMIDVDHFKAYNDSHGHPAGDALLRRAAAAWRGALRARDLVARYGGEEFAVLLPECDAALGLQVAERLRTAMPDGQTASIGLVQWNGEADAASLVMRADEALYRAKAGGRNRVVLG
jgi:diguanylate cyclase (GGDEF)-like protein